MWLAATACENPFYLQWDDVRGLQTLWTLLDVEFASLALIELKQRAMQLPNAGVDFQATDFAAVARALGGNGVTVHDRAALERAFSEALAASQFTVIGCVIDRRGYDGRL